MPKRTASNRPAIAACIFAVGAAASNELQLLPAGRFNAGDGRPFDADAWLLTPEIAARVIERASARANAFVIDYEHQTLHTEFNGKPAPAAGWFNTLAWRDSGLWATDVEWTDRARDMIVAGEYRYISAVFTYLPDSGEVLRIVNAGVTNNPALDGLAELELAAAAKYHLNDEDTQVNPELLKLLGLQAEASDEAALEAVTALKSQADDAQAKDEQIAALKAAEPDPAKYVPIAGVNSMKEELAALRKQVGDAAIDALVKPALEDGRLLPAQEDWARSLGSSDMAALKSYLDTAQPIAALKGSQTKGKQPDGEAEGELSAEQQAMCRAMGIDEADYLDAQE